MKERTLEYLKLFHNKNYDIGEKIVDIKLMYRGGYNLNNFELEHMFIYAFVTFFIPFFIADFLGNKPLAISIFVFGVLFTIFQLKFGLKKSKRLQYIKKQNIRNIHSFFKENKILKNMIIDLAKEKKIQYFLQGEIKHENIDLIEYDTNSPYYYDVLKEKLMDYINNKYSQEQKTDLYGDFVLEIQRTEPHSDFSEMIKNEWLKLLEEKEKMSNFRNNKNNFNTEKKVNTLHL